MAKRWLGGMLFAHCMACLTPSKRLAQDVPSDPEPVARGEVVPAGGVGPWPGADMGGVPAQ